MPLLIHLFVSPSFRLSLEHLRSELDTVSADCTKTNTQVATAKAKRSMLLSELAVLRRENEGYEQQCVAALESLKHQSRGDPKGRSKPLKKTKKELSTTTMMMMMMNRIVTLAHLFNQERRG